MKIPSKDKLSKLILENCDHEARTSTGGYRPQFYFYEDKLSDLCSKIVDLFKLTQVSEETPEQECIPDRVKIAELEAKIKVYEAVIDGAGIKLKMPTQKGGEMKVKVRTTEHEGKFVPEYLLDGMDKWEKVNLEFDDRKSAAKVALALVEQFEERYKDSWRNCEEEMLFGDGKAVEANEDMRIFV